MTEFLDNIALPRQGGPKPILAILRDGSPIGLAECCGQPVTEVPLRNASDLGYWLGEPYWAQGYATEAISALIDRVFAQPEAGVIRSAVFEGNTSSLNLQQKLGFEIIGNATMHCRPQGREVSLICTRLTRTRYATLGR
jgi:RimJ/RimL family protein N-acetyltransferase